MQLTFMDKGFHLADEIIINNFLAPDMDFPLKQYISIVVSGN
jgi:hypothetical protein